MSKKKKRFENRFESINDIDKSKLTEEQLKEYGFIKTLALSNDIRVIHEIETAEQLKLFNNHFRAGLSVRYNEDNKLKVKYECLGIYGGIAKFGKGKKCEKKMILKNAYLGNMYVADHCFVTGIKDNLPENIKFGDLILFTCYITKYTDNDNMPNFSLHMTGNSKIYLPNKFDKELLKLIKEDKREELNDEKYQIQSVKYKTFINAIITIRDLPERFVETFTLSIITGKCKEGDLMKGVDHLSIINIEYEEFLCKVYREVLNYIINDELNFGVLQNIIIDAFNKYFGMSSDRTEYIWSITKDYRIFKDNMDTLRDELIDNKIA